MTPNLPERCHLFQPVLAWENPNHSVLWLHLHKQTSIISWLSANTSSTSPSRYPSESRLFTHLFFYQPVHAPTQLSTYVPVYPLTHQRTIYPHFIIPQLPYQHITPLLICCTPIYLSSLYHWLCVHLLQPETCCHQAPFFLSEAHS